MRSDHDWLTQAVVLAEANVARGGGPFGALVVLEGDLLAEGANRVTVQRDPTAHAEVVAIRSACQALERPSLAGATLYTSCEPCPLCLASVLWARINRVVYAADRHQAAAAGFDDAVFHSLFRIPAQPGPEWPLRYERLEVADAEAPFRAWARYPGRTPY